MLGFAKIFIIILVIVVLAIGLFYFVQRSAKKPLLEMTKNNMQLMSPAFENNQNIPMKYTCDGEDISPPLQISQVPEKTESLALIVDDPDAPLKTWTHWLVWNIKPTINFIKEGEVPKGAVEGLNDFNKHSYGGPCPPSGVHHYYFKLYALDKMLDLDKSTNKEALEQAIKDSILNTAELVGLYQR